MNSPTPTRAQADPFVAGGVVLISLSSPREKFFGTLLTVNAAGVSVRGIELNSFEDFARQVRAGESVQPHAVFFPMHRVEKIELDVRNADIPSLQERFEEKTGRSFIQLCAADAP